MDSEEILWTGHPSNWHYAWAWVIGVLLAVVLIGFFVILWILVDRSRITYTVTATKVIREAGLWAKTSDEVRIRDIRSIAMRKGGFLGLAGVGDLGVFLGRRGRRGDRVPLGPRGGGGPGPGAAPAGRLKRPAPFRPPRPAPGAGPPAAGHWP